MENEETIKQNEDIPERLVQVLSINREYNTQITKFFLNLPTLVQKVEFILELLSKYDLSPIFIKNSKDNKKSVELRTKGNKLFSSKKDEEALEMYTHSIAFAENYSDTLALAYANRSAVLFRLGFFEECLIDIQRAIENNYPESLRHKINERKEKSLIFKSKQKKLPYHQPLPLIKKSDQNPLIECASKAIEIREDPKQGRCLVASRDIEIGEVIVVDRPTFCILTDAKWCHCYHCLTLSYCLLPCDSCTKVLFCSSTCKDISSSYHKYECPILASITSLGYNSCRYLPLRIGIMMKDHFRNLEEEIRTTENVYKSGRYKEIHDLVTNEAFRTPTDIFERITCTALYYILLRDYTNFFENNIDLKHSFMELVYRHLQTMACNFHDIGELFMNSDGIYEVTTIGAGAYNVLSLINHSCAPNVCRTNYGTLISVYAIETIKKGQQLFDNYGFHFAVHPKSTRQAKLKKQYHFHCGCRACENNWETLPNLKNSTKSFLMEPLIEHLEDLSNANVKMARQVRPTAIKVLKELEKHIPSFEFCQAQEIFKQCDGILGSVRRCLKSDAP